MFFSVNLNNFNDDLIQSDPIDIVNCPSGWIYIGGKYEIYLSTVFSIHLKGSSSSSQSVIIIVIIKSREREYKHKRSQVKSGRKHERN